MDGLCQGQSQATLPHNVGHAIIDLATQSLNVRLLLVLEETLSAITKHITLVIGLVSQHQV